MNYRGVVSPGVSPQRALACVLLSALLAHVPASAQDVAPASAAPEPVAPASAVEATGASPLRPAADAEVVRPTGPFVAPGAAEIAWRELHELQRRQAIVLQQREPAVPLPATGVALGSAALGVLLPWGSILVARSREGEEPGVEQDRRVGATLIALGLLGFAAVVAGSVALARTRKRQVRCEAELKSLADRRTLLENLLAGAWHTPPGQSAP
jgi:hypothetical protein